MGNIKTVDFVDKGVSIVKIFPGKCSCKCLLSIEARGKDRDRFFQACSSASGCYSPQECKVVLRANPDVGQE